MSAQARSRRREDDARWNGVLNVLKPPGMTSHDVVDEVRRLFGLRRVGHAGTLDPGAAGVLPVCLGRATRISEYLLGSDKEYRALLALGASTDTHDAQGTLLAEHDASTVTREALEEVLDQFRGTIRQVPPMVSAARHLGQRLYELAREGVDVDRPSRAVTVYRLELVGWWPGRRARAVLDLACSKGTYVRTLCHDIGAALGVGGYLHFLVRTRHGPFSQEGAVTLEELTASVREGEPTRHLLPPARALDFLPALELRPEEAERVRNGMPPLPRRLARLDPELARARGGVAGRLVRLLEGGDLLGLARLYPQPGGADAVAFRLEKVLGR